MPKPRAYSPRQLAALIKKNNSAIRHSSKAKDWLLVGPFFLKHPELAAKVKKLAGIDDTDEGSTYTKQYEAMRLDDERKVGKPPDHAVHRTIQKLYPCAVIRDWGFYFVYFNDDRAVAIVVKDLSNLD